MQKKQKAPQIEPAPPQLPTASASKAPPNELIDETTIENAIIEGLFAAGISAVNVLLRQCALIMARFTGAQLPKAHFADISFSHSDLANAALQEATLSRVSVSDCRLTGLSSTEGQWEDVAITNCHGELINFSGTTLKRVTFTSCNLTEADFYNTTLIDVRFIECELNRARFASAKSKRTDFRTSNVEGIQIGPRELQGVIIEPSQAQILIAGLGVSVRWPGDN